MKKYKVHTLVLGSGAAGLTAALRLHAEGIENIAILTEGLKAGTSINTGSDKQTYYKLGQYADNQDSPETLAETLFNGGAMHGDLALAEAALSARAFFQLVNIGVPFPRDEYGQFIGYKTDHDPLRRGTSCGPYTSREMCLCLIKEVKRRAIAVYEQRVAIKLLALNDGQHRRVCGVLAMTIDGEIETYQAENIIFAVGGPGGLYRNSVYPYIHTGAIGLALEVGAVAQNLAESQFGLGSVKYRWNVSGTYMQVMPKFISTATDGISDEQEFLRPYFSSAGEMNSMIFLKGYQWPFDASKAAGGSSLLDILVHIETVVKGRRVFLDFRENSEEFKFEELSPESHDYLKRSGSLFGTPLERLRHMNPEAIKLYELHNIHLLNEPLEIAVCAQHNNGGLAANHWWESVNIKHLFPIGEVNGSHGVYRPGGSALNSGQVGAFRAAEYIAAKYNGFSIDSAEFDMIAQTAVNELDLQKSTHGGDWREDRNEFQSRMSAYGAQIRNFNGLEIAAKAAWSQYHRLIRAGIGAEDSVATIEHLRNRQLCLAHAVYLEAIIAQTTAGVGSRGSSLLMDCNGDFCHPLLGNELRFMPENSTFRGLVLETSYQDGKSNNSWVPRRPLPRCAGWFENIWADYRNKTIYNH